MSRIIRSALFGMGLLTAAALSAHAQSENLAALPPGAKASPPPPIATLGPAATPEANTGDPRDMWKAPETQAHLGPAPNSDRTDSD